MKENIKLILLKAKQVFYQDMTIISLKIKRKKKI